ncbi:MAG: TonB family protein [Hyphomonadaceae bacterium]
MLRIAVIATALVFSQAAHAQAPTITNPVWLAQPDAHDFVENYPSQATEQYVEGRATIECFVRLDTTLTCSVTAESPASWGFGDAALAIARTFRVEPARVNGEPVEGGRIRRTIRFVMPTSGSSYEGLNPAQRAIAEAYESIVTLPTWDEAPPTAAVLLSTPEAARVANTQGRGILSCRINPERRLNCEPHSETPAGSGFAAAAMTLAPMFRVSPSSQDFADAHAVEPFILPISFGGPPSVTPVNRYHPGLGPFEAPPLFAPREAFPPEALAAGIRGTVKLLCTYTGEDLDCAVEEETPAAWGFANTVMEVINSLPPPPPDLGLIAGDQLRFRAEFIPD